LVSGTALSPDQSVGIRAGEAVPLNHGLEGQHLIP
jgi:hypothetical protein